ncbi:hypothetical protein HK096_008295 [Nowakowskiella sp. JEL0078]|nr:hypothetical protein HK096_008295 [Nowakowskiella sp. JEL0078]
MTSSRTHTPTSDAETFSNSIANSKTNNSALSLSIPRTDTLRDDASLSNRTSLMHLRSPSAASRVSFSSYKSGLWSCKSHDRRFQHDFSLCYKASDSRLAAALHAKLELASRYQWPQDPPIVFFDRSCVGLFPASTIISTSKSAPPQNGIALSKIVLYLLTDSSMQKISSNLQKSNKQDKFLLEIEEGLRLAGEKDGPLLCPIIVGDFLDANAPRSNNFRNILSKEKKASSSKLKVFTNLFQRVNKVSKTVINAAEKAKNPARKFDPFSVSSQGNQNHPDLPSTMDGLFAYQAIHLDPRDLDTAVAKILNIFEKELMPPAPKPKLTPNKKKDMKEASVYFSCREPEIQSVHHGIHSRHPVIISGEPGIGKSALAAKYASIYGKKFNSIFWISCESRNSAYAGLQNICNSLLLTVTSKSGRSVERSEIRRVANQYLERANDYLLILDQADDTNVVLDILQGVTEFGGSVIITSQDEHFAELLSARLHPASQSRPSTRVKLVRLRRWTTQQTYSFLCGRVPVIKTTDSITLKQILNLIDGLPMVAELICALITSLRLGPRRIGELSMDTENAPYFDSLRSLEIIFRMSVLALFDLDKNETTAGSIARAAIMILGLMSCVASTDVPREYLEAAVESRYSEAFRLLINMSLIFGSASIVSIHPAIQILGFNILGRSTLIHSPDPVMQQMWMQRSVRAMLLCFPEEVTPENEELAKKLRIHVFHSVGNATNQMDVDYIANIIELSDRMLAWLHYWKELQRARDLLEHQLFLTSSLHADKTSHADIVTALHNIGQVCLELGDLPASAMFFNQAIAAAVSNNGTRECDDVASSLNGLGQVSLEQGNSADAREFFKEALKIFRIVQSENPEDEDELGRDIAVTLNNVGLAASASGDYDTAWTSYQDALDKFVELHGGRYDKDVAQTLVNLANVAHARDDYEESIRLHLESLEIKKELYRYEMMRSASTDDEETSPRKSFMERMSISNLSRDGESIRGRKSIMGLSIKSKDDNAERKKSIVDRLSILGIELNDVEADKASRRKSFLAGNENEADKATRRKSIFGGNDAEADNASRHKSILGSLNRTRSPDSFAPSFIGSDIGSRISGSRVSFGRLGSPQRDRERKPVIVKNTDIANHLNLLGTVASDSGNYKMAEKFFTEALDTYIAVYGTRDHPECGLLLNNLGIAAYDRQDFDGAKKYYEQALSVYISVHGTRNHIDCAMAINNL